MREIVIHGLAFLLGAYLGMIIMGVLAAHGRTIAWQDGYDRGFDDGKSSTKLRLGENENDS